jgi:glycosyltransferase involved in cell wall biosynthesis
MKILLVHNRYRTSAPSGEDAAVRNELQMLDRGGIVTVLFDRCNDDLQPTSLGNQLSIAANTVWSQRSRRELRSLLRRTRPDVVHVHNTFSIVSPSIYGVCKEEGVPVVQTLHNFRFFCPGGLFLRDGKPCEDCVEKGLLQSVRHRCYRDSLAATGTLAAMLTLHRAIGTYDRYIDRYIALTEFGRSKIVKGGIPADKISIKPNFLPDPPAVGHGSGAYVAYVGRLSEGKGAETLIRAWRQLPDLHLKVVGDGALRRDLEALATRENLNVEFLGMRGRGEVLEIMGEARCLIVPSECYEGFPMVIAESFACGTPVLASRIGSLEELVPDGVRGGQFAPRDPDGLARRLHLLLSDEPALRRMRVNAREFFEGNLSESQNLARLSAIYSEVLAQARDVRSGVARKIGL